LFFIPFSAVLDCLECPPVLAYEKRGVAIGLKVSEASESVCGKVKEAETVHMHAEDVGMFLSSFDSGN